MEQQASRGDGAADLKVPPTHGLVLSGGGVRGVAHIGVIKALEEHGIHPEYISGASSGAIVGAFYAAGHGWEDTLGFFRSVSLFTWGNYAHGKPGMLDADKFREGFEKYFPDDRFEALQKKLFVVASDIVKGRSRVFHEGPLIRTLLASSAVPGVFSPVVIDDSLYSDGGITNNFPVEPLLAPCDRIIGVFVNPLKQVTAHELRSSFAVLERAFSMDRSSRSIQKFDDCDLIISPESLSAFGTFSTKHVDAIFRIGYEAALRKLEEYDPR
ncbi:MAG: patatin-like phospholipase family protein [Flavobacteriales bacterium]|nr:patatin-like phospholipase family protein [Flavobacteriales bacterium]